MKILVNQRYSRSINIERDFASPGVANYIVTRQGLSVFKRFVGTISGEDISRSWSLVGPYGAGKSSFGLFLANITGKSTDAVTVGARNSVRTVDKALAEEFGRKVRGTNGFLKVVLTGRPESILCAFSRALREAVERFWKRRPAFYEKICDWHDRPSLTQVVEMVAEIRAHLEEKFTKPIGFLIVIDELGKFLEYEARHNSAEGVYLLQVLAEMAYVGRKVNLYLFTLSHQSFDQYYAGLSKVQKDEWAKIQGRFESIAFVEPVDQVLRILTQAFSSDCELDDKSKRVIEDSVNTLESIDAMPRSCAKNELIDLFAASYPLHPFSVILLPLLCQKVAQNERTLFSFLSSEEPYGLRECVSRLGSSGFVYPHNIFDYFITNQSGSIFDGFTYRRWAEVVSALERLGDATDGEVSLLKTIGLVNIIGAHGGLRASVELLEGGFDGSADEFAISLEKLQSKSLIQYRKFSNEYRVWQGSDFDLEASLHEEFAQVRGEDLLWNLNARDIVPPIIASTHSIRTGTFRYFTPIILTENSIALLKPSDSPRVIYLFLRSHDFDYDLIVSQLGSMDVLAISFNYDDFFEVVSLVTCLEHVRDNNQDLKSDPIAFRELKDRLFAAIEAEQAFIRDIVAKPNNFQWTWGNVHLEINNKRELNSVLSRVLDDIYPLAPIIKNELINKNNPSAQAVTGRNKLILNMLSNHDKEDLGIDKFPAEKGIYRAVLKTTGMHIKREASWEFVKPSEENECNMLGVWNRIEEFLESTVESPRPFTDLDDELVGPPFGLRAGVLPIIYAAAYMVFRHELALYEEGKYIPTLIPDRYPVFIKRMDLFSFQLFRIDGQKANLLEIYKTLFNADGDDRNLLSIARPLALMFKNLPSYTKQTSTVSNIAKNVRSSFYTAESPHDLFFEKLPAACGLNTLGKNTNGIDEYLVKLRSALKELNDVFPMLVQTLFSDLSDCFGLPSEPDALRSALYKRIKSISQYLPVSGELSDFSQYALARQGTNQEWILRMFSFLAGRRYDQWSDEDLGKARSSLELIAQSFADFEKLALNDDRPDRQEFDRATLVRIVKKGKSKDSIVRYEKDIDDEVLSIMSHLESFIDLSVPREIKIAALVNALERILPDETV